MSQRRERKRKRERDKRGESKIFVSRDISLLSLSSLSFPFCTHRHTLHTAQRSVTTAVHSRRRFAPSVSYCALVRAARESRVRHCAFAFQPDNDARKRTFPGISESQCGCSMVVEACGKRKGMPGPPMSTKFEKGVLIGEYKKRRQVISKGGYVI